MAGVNRVGGYFYLGVGVNDIRALSTSLQNDF